MKLRKCICGKEAKLNAGIYGDELRFVKCDCGIASFEWSNGNRSAPNWNALQKRLLLERKKNVSSS